MAAPSDAPRDPETDRVVDPSVLAERRALRAGPSEPSDDAAPATEPQEPPAGEPPAPPVAEPEDRLVVLEREHARVAAHLSRARGAVATREVALREAEDQLLAGTREARALRDEADVHRVERDLAEQEADALRARVAALELELEAERGRRAAAEAALEEGHARAAAERAEAELAAQAAVVRAEAATEEAERTREAALAGRDTAELEARALAAEAAQEELAAELDGRRRLEGDVQSTLRALREELEEALRRQAEHAQRDAAMNDAVTGLGAQADRLEAEVAQRLAAATEALRAELAAAEAARAAAAEALAHEEGRRTAAERRADDAAAATEALEREVERLQDGAAANPIYGAVPSGPALPAPDHPALRRPEGPAPAADAVTPAVVADLMRAAERLRAVVERPTTEPPEGLRPSPAPAEDAASAEPPAPAEELAPLRTLAAPFAEPPPARPWLAPALAALATADAPTAERLLLALLPVQAHRIDRAVAYELVLPELGARHVAVRPGDGVVVTRDDGATPLWGAPRLEGPVAALAPLVAGGASRRLEGAGVRGRLRLRRLLRAMHAPVDLDELRRAGVRPRSGDLVALLCRAVPGTDVRGADFVVAFVVADENGDTTRTVVRAAPDGSLTTTLEAPADMPANATVTSDADGLIGVLAGTADVTPEGDADAVATLLGWLRDVQGLPS